MHYHLLISLLCAAAPAAAQGHDSHGHKARSTPDAEALYAKNCASCHLPPDSRFAVDRAWIAQLAETS